MIGIIIAFFCVQVDDLNGARARLRGLVDRVFASQEWAGDATLQGFRAAVADLDRQATEVRAAAEQGQPRLDKSMGQMG